MQFFPNNLYHVYNQGNNKQKIYFKNNDYLLFLKLFRSTVLPFSSVVSYCLMPNHFHFMILTDERCTAKVKQGGLLLDPVTNAFRKLLSSYCRIHNTENQKTGSLFRQKTKSKCLSGVSEFRNPLDTRDYYVKCFHYLHQNPLRAGLVNKLEDWEYSSFQDYAGIRKGTLVDKALGEELCGYNQETFVRDSYALIKENPFPKNS